MNVKSESRKPAQTRIALGNMERKVAQKSSGPYPSCFPGAYCLPYEK